jgi:FkbM family methyltransferase
MDRDARGFVTLFFFLVLQLVLVSVRADNEIGVLTALRAAYPDWKPRGIVDVGANGGGWTRVVQEEDKYPGVKTFMVEAFHENSVYLEEVKKAFNEGVVDYAIAVLSSMDGDTIKFHSMKNNMYSTGNSMFIEQSEHFTVENDKFELVNTTKLDTLLEHKMEHVDYLKLDVQVNTYLKCIFDQCMTHDQPNSQFDVFQGAELMVLLGATETLKKATFVQFEVSVIEYNKGGACWHEVDELLRRNGFYFYDSSDYVRIEEAFRTKGIGQFDALYIKPSSPYLPSWLVDNNATFCGVNKAGGGETLNKEGNMRGETMDAPAHVDQTFFVQISIVVISAFVGGYLAGRKSRVGKVSSKRL